MQKAKLKELDLPDSPGIYKFFENGKVLYIGRATSLRDRVRSYFSADLIKTRGPHMVDMVTKADELSYEATDSVLEAIVLEALEIKKYKPFYNSKDKDDKSNSYLLVTDEDFPRVIIVRGKELSDFILQNKIKKQFGPFYSANVLRQALNIIRKIFPFYDTKKPVTSKSKSVQAKVEFNKQINIYPKKLNKESYKKNIRHLILFFSGKKKKVIEELEKEMLSFAKAEKFEKAEITKRQIYNLTHIQDVSLIKEDLNRVHGTRIEAYDVAHTSGKGVVGVMTVIEDGELAKSEYKKFIIKEEKNDDIKSLLEILDRRFAHNEWKMPTLVVVDGGRTHKNKATKHLERLGIRIPVVSVVKNERHLPRGVLGDYSDTIPENDILLANAEAHRFAISFHRKRRASF